MIVEPTLVLPHVDDDAGAFHSCFGCLICCVYLPGFLAGMSYWMEFEVWGEGVRVGR